MPQLDDIEVDVPDYGTVHFPSDMDPAAIKEVLARKFGPRKPQELQSPISGSMGPSVVSADGYTTSGLESAPLRLMGKSVPTLPGSNPGGAGGMDLAQEAAGGVNTTVGGVLTALGKETSKPAPKVLLPGYRNGEWQGYAVANQDKADQAKAEQKAFENSSLRISGKYLTETGRGLESPNPSLPEKVARMAGGFAPVVMSGGAAPLVIAAQTEGETIDANYAKYKQAGMADEDALAKAVEDGQRAGLTQGVIWAALPKPLQAIVGKVTGKVGGGAVAQFVAKRAEGAATGAALGAASQAGGNLAAGQPVGENVLPAAAGMAVLGALTPGHGGQDPNVPRGGLNKEVQNAVQIEKPNAGVLRPEPSGVGLPQVGKGNAKPEIVAGEGEGNAAATGAAPAPVRAAEAVGEVTQRLDGLSSLKGGDLTQDAYKFGAAATPDQLAEMQRLETDHIAQFRALMKSGDPQALLGDASAKLQQRKQWLTEGLRFRKALEEAKSAGATTDAQLAAIAREHGVGSGRGAGDVSYAKDLKEALAAETAQNISPSKTGESGKMPTPEPIVDQPVNKPAEASTETGGLTEPTPAEPSLAEKGVSFLEERAKAARERIAERGKSTTFGSGPLHEVPNIADWAIVGASKLARGGLDFAQWSSAMVKEFGEGIKPHLQGIFDASQQHFGDAKKTYGGPGAAPHGVAGEGAAEGNPDTYGVAARVREERAKAGQVLDVPPGEGISAPDSVEHGRELLASGTNAEQVLSEFEKTKRLSSDDMAVVRARGEQLALEARRTEEKFGTDSPQYQKAWEDLSSWDARTKPMQTEWHKTGQAQQGETDIDTGTFTGLQRAHKEATGEDFTPGQAKKAKEVAENVSGTTQSADAAKAKLNAQLSADARAKSSPEQKALDAASKTVRAAATRTAAAESKAQVADAKLKAVQDSVAKEADEAALAAANKTIREAAARRAKAEAKSQVAEGARQTAADKLAREAEDKALAAAEKTVRDAAVRKVQEAHKAELKSAELAKQAAQVELQAAKKAEEAVQKYHREAAAAAAKAERARMEDPERAVWDKVRDYIEQGMDDYDEIRNKVATDLGMKVDEVTKLLGKNRPTKRLADEVWKKQQIARRVKEQAKRWLTNVDVPLYQKALQAIPRVMFSLKVGFHGTVALGTHAPMVAYQPRFWNAYVRDFGKMYKMVARPAYYERQVQDLLRRPNFTIARRAGLVNDPFVFEDYNSPDTSAYFGNLTGMGNRGYTVLKILRQDMFDQMWNKLPKTQQIPEVATAIADGLNHATGVVKGRAPAGSNVLLFAPRLMASRVAWLAVDPIKAVDTFARWRTADAGQKQFAINQVKEKAWVLGTTFAMLAINQGILSAIGSKQKVNLTDPMKSDFMKFKVAGETLSYGNAMLTMARLPLRLYEIRASKGGKLKNVVYPDEDTYSVLGEYVRSQESPFASLVSDLWFRSDWMRRNLPNSNRPMPARLRRQHVKPYTWTEFWSEKALPIPAEEATREVWKHGLGMSDEQRKSMYKAAATIALMGATGARLTDDTEAKK